MLKPTHQLGEQHRLLEILLVGATLTLSMFLWSCGSWKLVLLHLYYLPVVIAAFYLGSFRAGMLSVLSILIAGLIIVPQALSSISPSLMWSWLIAYVLWAAILCLAAVLTGTLSDAWRQSLEQMRESHENEVATDALTGVSNRRGFEKEICSRLADWDRYQLPVNLILIDIDHFKNFNDRYGHQMGDNVLVEVAKCIRESIRANDHAARYGGEEFAVIVPGADILEAQRIAERIRAMIDATRFSHGDMRVRVTVSVGLANALPGDQPTALIERADAGLYCSKDAGRNCSHYHDGESSQPFGSGLVAMSLSGIESHSSDSLGNCFCDEATGVPTFEVLVAELRRRVAEAQRYESPLSVAIIELDGHEDAAQIDASAAKHRLRTIVRLAISVLREPDLVARYDDKRICVMLPRTSAEKALIPMDRLRERAHDYRDLRYGSLSCELSIGIAEFASGDHAGTMLKKAQAALSDAATSGGNRVSTRTGAGIRKNKHELVEL